MNKDNTITPEERLSALKAEIIKIEKKVLPLQAELVRLKKEAGRLQGGIARAKTAQEKKKARNERVRAIAEARKDDKYRRDGGLNKALAKQFGLSERTIYTILNEQNSEIS